MNFEQTRVTLEPRSVANCLDLALLFSGRHLGPLLGVWTLFAVPLGLATYLAARWTNWGFLCAAVFGFLGSAPLGVMLACGAARTTFGEDFTFRKLLSDLTTDASLVGKILALRIPLGIAYAACLIPGPFLAVWWGFLAENQVLTQLHERRHDRRTTELIKLEFLDLVIRGGAISLFGWLAWILLEMTVDLCWTILFSHSLFFGRFGEMGSVVSDEVMFGSYVSHVWSLATSDPAVLALHVMTGLAVYAVCRLAWFFCYIDLRVRRDCWDLELEILSEADRLRTAGGAGN